MARRWQSCKEHIQWPEGRWEGGQKGDKWLAWWRATSVALNTGGPRATVRTANGHKKADWPRQGHAASGALSSEEMVR